MRHAVSRQLPSAQSEQTILNVVGFIREVEEQVLPISAQSTRNQIHTGFGSQLSRTSAVRSARSVSEDQLGVSERALPTARNESMPWGGLRQPDSNSVRRKKTQGRPYEAPFSTRLYTGVGVYAGSRPYVAAQFPDVAKRSFVKELSETLGQTIRPAADAHLTLVPPSTKLDPSVTTKDLFGSLEHSSMIFKKVAVTKRGAVLLVAEDTTSTKVLRRQLDKAADHYGLPKQTRELHIVLGHVDLGELESSRPESLQDYRGDNGAYRYMTSLAKPISLDLNLTAEGNLIAEQITSELGAVPPSQRADSASVKEALCRFEERASNVERLVQAFLTTGSLSEEDYEALSYAYLKQGVEPYRNNPIYFTAEMLIKAREKNIPLSYQVVSKHLVAELQEAVSGKLSTHIQTIALKGADGSVETREMAIIDNPELVVEAFQRDLARVFEGFDDVVVQQVGSGVTGFSRNPDKPIKPCNVLEADVDLAIKSKQILEQLDQSRGISHLSVNRKIKLANKYTVLANASKSEGQAGFGETELGQRIARLSQKWSYLLAGQSKEDNLVDPIVDFKLNIDTTLFESGATLLDLRR